jgi:membrane protein YqaA with SNARE-associated domain
MLGGAREARIPTRADRNCRIRYFGIAMISFAAAWVLPARPERSCGG